MADAKKVVLYAPTGTKVSVSEGRAEVLKGRGYVTSKPKPPAPVEEKPEGAEEQPKDEPGEDTKPATKKS